MPAKPKKGDKVVISIPAFENLDGTLVKVEGDTAHVEVRKSEGDDPVTVFPSIHDVRKVDDD